MWIVQGNCGCGADCHDDGADCGEAQVAAGFDDGGGADGQNACRKSHGCSARCGEDY